MGTPVILYTCGTYANETFSNIYTPTVNWSVLKGDGKYGVIQIPDAWNGYGYVPSPERGAKLIEGRNTLLDSNLNSAILWCITPHSCDTSP